MNLKVHPDAKHYRAQSSDIAAENTVLKVSVMAMVKGCRANAAIINPLAKRWTSAKGRFSLISGATSRQKVIEIVDADRSLLDKRLRIEETSSR